MWSGFVFAAGAAIGHSCIDASRKWASQRFSTAELVALVALVDSLLLVMLTAAGGSSQTLSLRTSSGSNSHDYAAALLVSAAIKLLAAFMYQRALKVSPLSVTIPYLAFTPVLLVFTSYILINELPSWLGLVGVITVTLGGYFLSLDHGTASAGGEVEQLKKDRVASAAAAVKLVSFFPWSSSAVSAAVALEQIKVESPGEHGPVAAAAAAERNFFWLLVSKIASWWPSLEWEEGSILMLGVAGLLSVGNSLDKMAAHLAPSVVGFAALQRSLMALPAVLYLLLTSPKSFKLLVQHSHILLAIASFEVVAFICYLKSLEVLLVSYAVAAKRSNVLLSVLIARIVFKERIWRRLPFILMMVLGMALILFA